MISLAGGARARLKWDHGDLDLGPGPDSWILTKCWGCFFFSGGSVRSAARRGLAVLFFLCISAVCVEQKASCIMQSWTDQVCECVSMWACVCVRALRALFAEALAHPLFSAWHKGQVLAPRDPPGPLTPHFCHVLLSSLFGPSLIGCRHSAQTLTLRSHHHYRMI